MPSSQSSFTQHAIRGICLVVDHISISHSIIISIPVCAILLTRRITECLGPLYDLQEYLFQCVKRQAEASHTELFSTVFKLMENVTKSENY
jgi:hypothetical protein